MRIVRTGTGGRAAQRAPLLVISGAVAGFAGLIGWHSVAATGAAPLAAPAGPARSAGKAGQAGKAAAGSGRHPGRAGATRQPAAAGGAGAAAGAVRTANGPAENFGYGTIAVRVAVRGNRIIAASISILSTLEPTSQQISAQAIPILHSEVLAAHSANINGVSGATYTSQGYYQSLQAALAKLHVS
jgi:uncharacterized protein with FMN-binding domain